MQKINLIITREESLKLDLGVNFIQTNCPLSVIEEIKNKAVSLDGLSGIIFTSMNGVKFFASTYDKKDYCHLEAYCVGEKTAQTAREYGFNQTIFPQQSNALSLCDLINNKKPKKLLYARAEVVSEDIKNLASATIISEHILYRAKAINHNIKDWENILKTNSAICFFSATNANLFEELISKNKLSHLLKNIDAFCLSEKISHELKTLPFRNILSSPISDLSSLSKTIKNYYEI